MKKTADTVIKSYAFNARGNGEFKLIDTCLPIGKPNVNELLAVVKNNTDTGFMVEYGTIREISSFRGQVLVNAPSKVGMEKFQAFILKREGDTITHDDKMNYFINKKQLMLNFSSYDVSIIEI